jgi:phosphonate transport system permease protein
MPHGAYSTDIPLPPAPSMLKTLRSTLLWTTLLCLLLWGWVACNIRPYELLADSGNMLTMAFGGTSAANGIHQAGFLPPDFRSWQTYLEQMVITVHMAIWGSLLAVICAIPFGLLSAENMAPWWIRQPVRRMMDSARAINELVFALIFVAAVGLGPMAGVLALWVHTTGVLAKLFSEAVEAIDHRPVDGITVTGANHLEEIVYGVIPQVIPLWISFSLYRFESNVRSATVVGLVGAGGIGMVLHESMRSFDYAAAGAILIIIVLAVVVLDVMSAYLRKMFL